MRRCGLSLARPVPFGGYALTGDWLWIGVNPRPWGRMSLETGRREEFPMPREQGNSFEPLYLQPLSGGSRILVGDGYGLWVLTPPAP